ncbi:uncharacterized protein LOC130711200 [Lotus japonicus]|uniref:uncharacterized protein LOC130711200 n=1 Tax=Lotus japonicus TaxID=34305 RepID=UPI002585E97C|nr:uncharacterized protein LOC130711200 [Lotus japonicus]
MTDLISDVCLSKSTSSFAARILRMWTLPSFDNPSDIGTIDIVLMDHQSSKIQASIKGSAVIEIFNGKLMEGEVYQFSGLAVSDIIGLLSGQPRLTHYGKGKTKILNIDLLIDGHKMECALFDNVFFMVILYKGKNVLQNSMYGTKIFFNPDIPEVLAIKQSIMVNQSLTPFNNQLNDPSQLKPEDDFLRLTPRMDIEQMKECRTEMYVVFQATVKHIIDPDDWWYAACVCHKSVHQRNKLNFCDSCNQDLFTVYPRYRIKLRAIDDKDSATLVIFYREASIMLNKSCADLIQILDKNGSLHTPPNEILQLAEKTFLFKVEIKQNRMSNYEACYPVKRLTDDVGLIQKFIEMTPNQLIFKGKAIASLSETDSSYENTYMLINTPKDLLSDFTAANDDNNVKQTVDQVITYKRKVENEANFVADGSSVNRLKKVIKVEKN